MFKTRHTGVILVAVVLGSGSYRTTLAQPTAFTYQGRLNDGGGPASGAYDMLFRVFNADVDGIQYGADFSLPGVAVESGLFNVKLDFGAGIFAASPRWLEIEVNGQPLTPRQEITATPFAMGLALPFEATDTLDAYPFSITATADDAIAVYGQSLQGHGVEGVGNTGVAGSGNVGVAGNGSAMGVYGEGPIGVEGAGDQSGVHGVLLQSAGGSGVFGEVNGSGGITNGVYGKNPTPGGRGVFGHATAATSANYGVLGQSDSTAGRGIYGIATAGTGATNGGRFETSSTSDNAVGVFGLANAATGITFGVRGESDSTSGLGVFGWSTPSSGATYGVYGRSDSSSGNAAGVFGSATAASGVTYGVWGQTASTDGRGVYGKATAASGTTTGVYGRSDSTSGTGVYGTATAGTGNTQGVVGVSSSATGTGVVGSALSLSGNAVGGYFQSMSGIGVAGAANVFGVYSYGNIGATGSKPFRIDHPDDPANKYLLHYAAESPEVINFYSGKAMLDDVGEAVVELPHYFAKINKDPRYTLTAVGAPMPLLHVAQEIDEAALSAGARAGPGEAAPACSFRIAGGAPGAKASWEVKAVRNDQWVQQRGSPVEVEKHGLERGKYQHPELYGQPAEKGMNYEAAHERRSPPPVSDAAPG